MKWIVFTWLLANIYILVFITLSQRAGEWDIEIADRTPAHGEQKYPSGSPEGSA